MLPLWLFCILGIRVRVCGPIFETIFMFRGMVRLICAYDIMLNMCTAVRIILQTHTYDKKTLYSVGELSSPESSHDTQTLYRVISSSFYVIQVCTNGNIEYYFVCVKSTIISSYFDPLFVCDATICNGPPIFFREQPLEICKKMILNGNQWCMLPHKMCCIK